MSNFVVDYVDEHIELRLYGDMPKQLGKIIEAGIAWQSNHYCYDVNLKDAKLLADELLEE